MNICLFYHSLISDWNNGNAHFLRGIISAFQKRNFNVKVFEPENGWNMHIPRRPYIESLPGIPTIRPFEAMACEIPLICSPWNDTENLFTKGMDYLSSANGKEMESQLKAVLSGDNLARMLSENGLLTIRKRHTCEHRVLELLNIITTKE